jgi:hypothetical protein
MNLHDGPRPGSPSVSEVNFCHQRPLAAMQKILGHDRLTTRAICLNLTDTHVVDEYSQKW